MTDAPHLLSREEDPILIVTLNRPEKLNALSAQLLRLFDEALRHFRDTPALSVMLIRATGRYFSAGADLREGGDKPQLDNSRGSSIRERHRLGLNGMQRMYDEMEHIEKPIVVAHHAPCIGGGLELSLSCDFRLAAASAQYGFPENKHGVIPASNGVSRLTRICGTHWARWLIMAGQPVSAAEAWNMGLVHRVYPDDGFEDAVMKFCRHLAGQDAEQMGTAKLAIELARDVSLDQARQVERMANSTLMMRPGQEELRQRHLESVGGKKPGPDA